MKKAKYIVVGAALYLVFLLALAPVGLIWQLAPFPNSVEARGLAGTLWQGTARQLIVNGRVMDDVSWELDPFFLLIGRANGVVNFDGVVRGRGRMGYGLGGLEVQALQVRAPLPWLLAGQRLPLRSEVQGELSLNFGQSSQGEPYCEALNGRLLMYGLDVSNQFGQFPLGNLTGVLSCDNGLIKMTVDESENQIGLQGEVMLLADNQVQVLGKIRPTVAQPEDLRRSLSLLGEADANGAYSFDYTGPFAAM